MSSVPGGTGENLVYLVLCGGAFAGALTYVSFFMVSGLWEWKAALLDYVMCFDSQAYRTVTTDSARFTDRITEIEERPKSEWKPKPWPPKSKFLEDSNSGENGNMCVCQSVCQDIGILMKMGFDWFY